MVLGPRRRLFSRQHIVQRPLRSNFDGTVDRPESPEHRGIRIIGVSDGYDTSSGAGRKLLRGVRGLISETNWMTCARKLDRGLTGQIERGYHAGGLSYGYRSVVAGVNARGEPIGHRLEIDDAQAAIVREIFARYGEGESCQRIAANLNARGVRGPRGGTCACPPLRLAGEARRSAEQRALRRPIRVEPLEMDQESRYRKTRAIHSTGERMAVGRASRAVHPRRRAWHAVRERMASPRRAGGRRGRGGVPMTLLGGVMRCGYCGGSAVVKINARTYGCAAHKDRGPAVCGGVEASFRDVDHVVVGYVRRHAGRTQVHALVTGLDVALRTDVAPRPRRTARDVGRRAIDRGKRRSLRRIDTPPRGCCLPSAACDGSGCGGSTQAHTRARRRTLT